VGHDSFYHKGHKVHKGLRAHPVVERKRSKPQLTKVVLVPRSLLKLAGFDMAADEHAAYSTSRLL
jgi:hypothetical protein